MRDLSALYDSRTCPRGFIYCGKFQLSEAIRKIQIPSEKWDEHIGITIYIHYLCSKIGDYV